jgi:glycosyltransferase involved in cell wall biosynthesis
LRGASGVEKTMKILVVSPFLPSPPRFGGQRRIDGIARYLAARHELSVLAFNRPDPWTELSLTTTNAYCHEVVSLPERDFEERDKRRIQLRSLASRYSFDHLVKARRRDFQVELNRLLARTRYDIVQFEFTQMAAYDFARNGAAQPKFVLDEHNIEYDLVKRSAEAGGGFVRRVYNSLNWRKLAREETASWRRFDGVVVTSERDEAFVKRDFRGARTLVAPNGVDVDAFAPGTAAKEPDMLLFFGAINYFPNHDGVVFFIDHVFPKIRARFPNVRFCVLGPGANDEVQARAGSGVEILGMVDDVGPYIDRAAAVVVPLRIGGGTRLKIVEALAKGKAVVSTRLGAEGIDVVDGEHLLLADEPQALADAVARVLTDQPFAERLGVAARKLAVERYAWAHVGAKLERFYAELLGSGAASGARRG